MVRRHEGDHARSNIPEGPPIRRVLRLEGPRAKVKRTKEAAPSLLVDFDESGRALGLEILAFDDATLARINEILVSSGHAALPDRDLAPLRAA